MCIALCLTANSQTNVKINRNGISDFQNMPEYIKDKGLGTSSLKVTYLLIRENPLLMHRGS